MKFSTGQISNNDTGGGIKNRMLYILIDIVMINRNHVFKLFLMK